MRAFLKSSEGCFQLNPHTTTIGRHEGSDVVLQTAGVADHHAALKITAWDNGFVLQDFNSPHGTFVNGCQVQNAAVKVSPGDILRFGTGGASFELVVDGAAQMSYPPAKRRTAWSGRLQVVAEPKSSTPASPPRLPLLHRQHPPGSPGTWAPGPAGHVPHRPLRERPGSTWAGSVATVIVPDAVSRTSAVRPGSSGVSGVGASGVGGAPDLGTGDTELPRQEQGENLRRLERESGRCSGLEAEAKPKDAAIRDLQDAIAAMAKTLAQATARNEVELTQKLLAFERELGAKTEEIDALREQLSNAQKDSSQVFSHSLYERDLEIGRLRKESEKSKRDHALAAGLASSLQREVAGKEQKIQQLQRDVETLRKENREKDRRLAVVSAQCSRIKEARKREVGEREVIACRNRIGELERVLEGLQGEVQKSCAEQESIGNQLAEKGKAEGDLQEACARQARQLQEMGRRERLLRADLGRAREQLDTFKTQVARACSPAAAGVAEKAVTEQQVIEKVRQLSDEHRQSRESEKRLQEELSSRLSKEKEVAASVEAFEKCLRELQACLQSSCGSDRLRGELGRLEATCLDPCVSAVGAAVVEMARVPLSWLEGAERLLASVGMDLRASGKAASAVERQSDCCVELAENKLRGTAQLERAWESQAALLREQAKELEATHEQELRRKIEEVILEKDRESQEMLESAVAEERGKCQRCVEEERKTIRELESHLRSATEAIARKSEEREVADRKLREAVRELEETARREMALERRVLGREEQLQTVREEKELERQKLEEEVAEFKEQSKQHALTIVALEDRLLAAEQQRKRLEEENAALLEKAEGFRGDGRESTRGARLEVSPGAEPHSCPREELAAARSALLSKEAVVAGLTKELAETRARMSDMRGELSEEQKVELERNRRQLKRQEREVNLLREKLSQMSSLAEEKDRALKAAAEEVRQGRAPCQALKDASCETAEKPEDAPETPTRASEASEREPALDLGELGAKCRGLRHEETIRRQKEGLAELRQRLKMLAKRQSSGEAGQASEEWRYASHSVSYGERNASAGVCVPAAAAKEGSELPAVLAEGFPGERGPKTGLEKEPAPVSGAKRKAGEVPGRVPTGGSHGAADGAASSETAEAADLGEKMYLGAVGALGSLMQVAELSGMRSLQQLPQEERGEASLRRRKGLELLYDKVRNLRSRLERKEAMLKDCEGSAEQLRLSQASLRRCREEMAKLAAEAYREAEEKALLKEALERTQLQLNREKRLRRAAKPRERGSSVVRLLQREEVKEPGAEPWRKLRAPPVPGEEPGAAYDSRLVQCMQRPADRPKRLAAPGPRGSAGLGCAAAFPTPKPEDDGA
ncbi:forkhead-associated domain-containing protein 1 [Cariama cristata]